MNDSSPTSRRPGTALGCLLYTERMTKKITSLAHLERQLTRVNVHRHGIIRQIEAALKQLTLGSYAPMAGLSPDFPSRETKKQMGRRAGFTMSAAARKKISLAAKKRWAAKKAAERRK